MLGHLGSLGRLGASGRGGPSTHSVSILAPTLDLDTASDTGSSSSDDITSDTTPTINVSFGTPIEEGDLILVNVDSVDQDPHIVGSTEAATQLVTITFAPLAEGSHVISAAHQRGSAISAYSSTLTVVIDTTAPVLSSPSGDVTGDTTANLSCATDTAAGTMYWVITQSSTAPSGSQVAGGKDHTGVAAIASGSGVVSVSPFTASVATLTSSTTYYAYFCQDDLAGNRSAVASTPSFTTTGAAAFTPADLAGLVAWWKSDTGVYKDAGITPVSADGDHITQWNDQAGSNHLVQTVTNNQPKYSTANALNSLPVVQADTTGILDAMATGSAFTLGGDGDKLSVFVVLKAQYTQAGRVFGLNVSGSDNGATGGALLVYPDTTHLLVQRNGNKATAAITSDWNKIGCIWDGTNVTLYVNNLASTPSASSGSFASSFTSFDILSSPSKTNNLGGLIAEMIVCNRALTSTERNNIDSYFSTRYGI